MPFFNFRQKLFFHKIKSFFYGPKKLFPKFRPMGKIFFDFIGIGSCLSQGARLFGLAVYEISNLDSMGPHFGLEKTILGVFGPPRDPGRERVKMAAGGAVWVSEVAIGWVVCRGVCGRAVFDRLWFVIFLTIWSTKVLVFLG